MTLDVIVTHFSMPSALIIDSRCLGEVRE